MINFEEELKKYKPVIELDDIGKTLTTDEEIRDIVDIIMRQYQSQTDLGEK